MKLNLSRIMSPKTPIIKIYIKFTSFINPPLSHLTPTHKLRPNFSLSLDSYNFSTMDDDDHDMACTLDLSLELGLGGYSPKKEEKQKVNHDIVNHDDEAKGFNMKRSVIEENQHQNGGSTNHTNDKNGSRKKLRLTKEQSAMLEDTFKLHNTINPVYTLNFSFLNFLFIFSNALKLISDQLLILWKLIMFTYNL